MLRNGSIKGLKKQEFANTPMVLLRRWRVTLKGQDSDRSQTPIHSSQPKPMLRKLLLTLTLTTGIIFCLNPESARADYTVCANSDRLCLKKGDSGPIISALVKDLRKAGYNPGKNTDRFTSEVENAVKSFQRDHQHVRNDTYQRHSDLDIDGIVGKDTILRVCQKVYRGCDADASCYTGSPQLALPCYRTYDRVIK